MVNAKMRRPIYSRTDSTSGFGKRNTSNAFVVACNKFVYFDALPVTAEETEDSDKATAIPETAHYPLTSSSTQQATTGSRATPLTGPAAMNSPPRYPLRSQLVAGTNSNRRTFDRPALLALTSAIKMSSLYEQDYVNLAEVGDKLIRISPDVNPRNYGYDRLREFVVASGIVELRMKNKEPAPPIALVRITSTSIVDTSAQG